MEYYELKVGGPYRARFGTFALPDLDESYMNNFGLTWSFLGIVDPEDSNRRVFFVGDSFHRPRVAAAQTGWLEQLPDKNRFYRVQPATMHERHCPEVELGQKRWELFMKRDPSIIEELARLAEIMRRVDGGSEPNRTVYNADKLLARYDELIKRPVII